MPRSDLRTMVETLHVTTVRSLSRDRRGGIGKAGRIPTKKARFFPPSAAGEDVERKRYVCFSRCEKSGSNQLCIWLTADVTRFAFSLACFLSQKRSPT